MRLRDCSILKTMDGKFESYLVIDEVLLAFLGLAILVLLAHFQVLYFLHLKLQNVNYIMGIGI